MPDLDLLVIHPGASHGIYGSDLAADLIACEPPLWSRLIAGYARDCGFTVAILDAEAEQLTATEAAARAWELKPRLYCVAVYGHQPSASTQQMLGASVIARHLRYMIDALPSPSKVIMVGGHVAALPERTLREEAAHYACNGEGPVTIVGLLEGQEQAIIPGLVWRDPRNGPACHDCISNPPAPLIPAADLHGDAWDLLPMHLYRSHNWQCFGDLAKRQPYASIYTTLGCPYRCSFCCINAPFATANRGGNSYRMRGPIDVVQEMIDLWLKHGVKTLKIVDEMFVLNERHYTAICEQIIAAKQNTLGGRRLLPDDLNIWAYARIDTVKPHTLAMFRKAGIRWLALGIESGSKHVRDGADKALRHEDIVGVVQAIQAAGINVIGNYIFGLPDDTCETMQDTLALALALRAEFANFYCAMAYPGSALYREANEKGWALPATWAGYSQHNDLCRPLDTEHVDAATVLKFRDDAFTTYFTNPAYLAMIAEKFGPETLEHVKGMTTFKLPRKLLTGEIR